MGPVCEVPGEFRTTSNNSAYQLDAHVIRLIVYVCPFLSVVGMLCFMCLRYSSWLCRIESGFCAKETLANYISLQVVRNLCSRYRPRLGVFWQIRASLDGRTVHRKTLISGRFSSPLPRSLRVVDPSLPAEISTEG